jgi:tRNA pseudouridine38-40 synthase
VTDPARWRLTVAYDGSGFRGFAAQRPRAGADAVPTVAGALAAALARTVRLDAPPPLTCAGRTDAGVHARGQVVHVDLPDPLPPARSGGPPMGPAELARALNRQLAPAVVVRRADRADPGFDARRSATARRYRYLVWNAPVPDPLLGPLSWHVPGDLDLRAMAGATDALLGEHDFRAFCRRPPGSDPAEPLTRRVTGARWTERPTPEGAGPGRLLALDIEAASFCHQMVRSVTAFVVEVGRGRATAADMVARLRAGDRSGAPRPAPPEGLCLVAVTYG